METRCSLARCHLQNLCGMKECTKWFSSGWMRSAESQMASGSGGPDREEMIPTWIWKFLTRHRSGQESSSSKEPSTSDLYPRTALQLRKHRSPPQRTSDAMVVPASRDTHSSWPTPCLKAARSFSFLWRCPCSRLLMFTVVHFCEGEEEKDEAVRVWERSMANGSLQALVVT